MHMHISKYHLNRLGAKKDAFGMGPQKMKVELLYHDFPEANAEMMAEALQDRFDVTCSAVLLISPLSVVEMEFGAIAAVSGTTDLSKVMESIAEDLSESSTDFLQTFTPQKGIPHQLRISFIISGVRFLGEVTSDRNEDFLLAFRNIEQFFLLAERIIAEGGVPDGAISEGLNPEEKDQIRSIEGNIPSRGQSIRIIITFNERSRSWNVEGVYKEELGVSLGR
jgi:hypothetical protein